MSNISVHNIWREIRKHQTSERSHTLTLNLSFITGCFCFWNCQISLTESDSPLVYLFFFFLGLFLLWLILVLCLSDEPIFHDGGRSRLGVLSEAFYVQLDGLLEARLTVSHVADVP